MGTATTASSSAQPNAAVSGSAIPALASNLPDPLAIDAGSKDAIKAMLLALLNCTEAEVDIQFDDSHIQMSSQTLDLRNSLTTNLFSLATIRAAIQAKYTLETIGADGSRTAVRHVELGSALDFHPEALRINRGIAEGKRLLSQLFSVETRNTLGFPALDSDQWRDNADAQVLTFECKNRHDSALLKAQLEFYYAALQRTSYAQFRTALAEVDHQSLIPSLLIEQEAFFDKFLSLGMIKQFLYLKEDGNGKTTLVFDYGCLARLGPPQLEAGPNDSIRINTLHLLANFYAAFYNEKFILKVKRSENEAKSVMQPIVVGQAPNHQQIVAPHAALKFVLMVDHSGSMQNAIPELQNQLYRLIDYLALRFPAASLLFNLFDQEMKYLGIFHFDTPQNIAIVKSKVAAITSDGGTHLDRCLLELLRGIESDVENENTVLIFFTDGLDEESRPAPTQQTDLSNLLEKVSRNLRIMSVGLGNSYRQDFFRRIANATNQPHTHINDIGQFYQRLEAVFNDESLRQRMLLDIQQGPLSERLEVPIGQALISNTQLQENEPFSVGREYVFNYRPPLAEILALGAAERAAGASEEKSALRMYGQPMTEIEFGEFIRSLNFQYDAAQKERSFYHALAVASANARLTLEDRECEAEDFKDAVRVHLRKFSHHYDPLCAPLDTAAVIKQSRSVDLKTTHAELVATANHYNLTLVIFHKEEHLGPSIYKPAFSSGTNPSGTLIFAEIEGRYIALSGIITPELQSYIAAAPTLEKPERLVATVAAGVVAVSSSSSSASSSSAAAASSEVATREVRSSSTSLPRAPGWSPAFTTIAGNPQAKRVGWLGLPMAAPEGTGVSSSSSVVSSSASR